MGILLSAEKRKRAAVFAELYEFNELLLMNLRFGREDIASLSQGFKYMGDVASGKTVLNGADDRFLNEYAGGLGQSDALSQIDYLSERKVYIKKYKDESFAEYKKYRSLYLKIFFMLGVLIAVLLA